MFRFYEGKNKKKSVCLGRNENKFNTKKPKSQREMFNIQNTFSQNLFSVLNI